MALVKIVVLDGHTTDPGDNPWPDVPKNVELIVYPTTSREELVHRAFAADILITNKTPIDRALLEQLPRLKYICVLATGYNVVDVEAARTRMIPVSNVPSYGTDTVAQYTIALILELCHHIGQHAESVRGGQWTASNDWSYWLTPQVELRGLTLGVVGFGRIGQRVAELAHAFGMRILYLERPTLRNVAFPAQPVSRDTLFSEADIVTLHCSLTPDNHQFVNAEVLRQMKPSAFLINTARGQLVHEADLAAALQAGVLAGAAFDVLSGEPPGPENPLLNLPQCLITPHMAWASLAARRRIVKTTVENIEAFLKGVPIHVVNPVER